MIAPRYIRSPPINDPHHDCSGLREAPDTRWGLAGLGAAFGLGAGLAAAGSGAGGGLIASGAGTGAGTGVTAAWVDSASG